MELLDESFYYTKEIKKMQDAIRSKVNLAAGDS